MPQPQTADPRADRTRLSSADWEAGALDLLAEQGVTAVAVEPLARRLGVTKGSFYWHFPSREALLKAALERWEKLDEETVFEPLEEIADPAERLRELKASSPLGYILAAGLANAHAGRDVMKESIEDAASHVIHDLERYLNALGTIAEVTPLLGLLGTVIGMIDMFTQVMLHGAGNAALLAGGISTALIATAGGLIVAIPTLIVHRHFLRRVDTIVVGLEQEATKLVDAMHGGRQVDVRESSGQ